MKTLHFYILKQVIVSLLISVAVFSLILLLGRIVKEIILLLMEGKASGWVIAQAIALIMPNILVYALPFGMLASCILIFGRFSVDQELTAVRAGGISLLSLSSPIILFSLLLTGVCWWLNSQIAPNTKSDYKVLLSRAASEGNTSILSEKQFNYLGSYDIYVYEIEGRKLKDVRIHQRKDGKVHLNLSAEEGHFEIDRENELLNFTLYDVFAIRIEDTTSVAILNEYSGSIPIKLNAGRSGKSKLSELTVFELIKAKRDMESKLGEASYSPEEADDPDNLLMPILVQMNEQSTLSFACFSFTLVGIPLGIRAHRRETSTGMALSIVLVLFYFGLIIVAKTLERHAEWYPHLLIWLPNFVFQASGAVLLWRANRGW